MPEAARQDAAADLPKERASATARALLYLPAIHAVVGHWAPHPCTTPVPDKIVFAPSVGEPLRAMPQGPRQRVHKTARAILTAEHSDAGPKGESQGWDEQFRSRRNCGQMLGPGSTDRLRTPWRIADFRYFTR